MAFLRACDGIGDSGRAVYDTVHLAVGTAGSEDTAWQRF